MKIQDVEKIAAIFIGCALGSVILHFAAPFILAILVSAASFAVPFAGYHFFFKKGWRIRLVREPSNSGQSDADDKERKKGETAKAGPEKNPESACGQESSELAEDGLEIWYEMKGKPQFQSLRERMWGKGIQECWIRKDGICNVRTAKGYRRIQIFYGYPGDQMSEIADCLRKDGVWAEERGKYLYINWRKNQEAAE